MSKRIKSFVNKNKVKLIISLIAFIIFCLLIQAYIFLSEKMTQKDILIESAIWSEYCDGDMYNSSDRDTFCNNCLSNKSTCDWPLDFNININKVEMTKKTLGEIHCFFIIDKIDYLKERGSYFGITSPKLFTWQVLDSSKYHEIEFCCGIERESILSTLFMLEKPIKQACAKTSIPPRCMPQTI